MKISKILPKKFSFRLFVMTFVAGLIPVCIFALLIDIYGRQFSPEIRRTIQRAYDEEWTHSEVLLRDTLETLIQQKASDVALQIDLILQSHPYMTLQDLKGDREFWKIATQPFGKTGHASLYETNTGIIRFHRDKKLRNKGSKILSRGYPALWAIIRDGRGGKHARGYYELSDENGEKKQTYMCTAPLRQMTADNVALSVAVSASVEEFTNPIRDAEVVHHKTAEYLTISTEKLLRSFRRLGVLYMGLGIVMISLIAFGVGVFFSRAITRLRVATQKVNEGDLYVSVKSSMSGEVETLTEDFNRMVARLAETTVSKRLLEASEQKLLEANRELQNEIQTRAHTERALANEKERLAVTLRSIGDGVITTDREGKIVLMNHAAEALTGWSQSDAGGRALTSAFQSVDEATGVETVDPVRPIVETGKPMKRETTQILRRRDGVERIVALNGAPIRDNEGKILGVVVVFRDVTQQRKTEEELLRIRKLESVGTLAGGIAHDFNNLLAVILGNISFAKALTDPEDIMHRRLMEAENAVFRGKELTHRLLVFSKGGEPLRQLVSLKGIIQDSANITISGSRVKAVFAIADDLWQAEIDQGQIRQVIHNLVMNAREAMREGGTVSVRAENVTVGGDDGVPLPEGHYVRISVEDQGVGIPETELPRIFDPYYTTKEMGNVKGMGLGLAISYSTVHNHGGFITAQSRVGVGTTIVVYLPAHREEMKQEPEAPERTAQIGKCKVLYMDDEGALRDIAAEMLAYMGHDVAVASDGAEALKLYTAAMKSGKPFDLVIMDLTIPGGMGADEAVQRLLEVDPKLRAILTSGYASHGIVRDFKEYGFAGVLVKPYDVKEMEKVIRSVMATDAT
ncbi:MAG: Blue-light-activated protein [Syntrophorhabdus sp. PtaU1.Bin153]|nr:MAG: Blue-light-activated protein [Syntrophorhabdus sp. PtaU1.Bin153]